MKLLLSISVILCFFNSRIAYRDYEENNDVNKDPVLEQIANQQASVRRYARDIYRFGFGHICGGFLVSANVVLTAAHCFLDLTKYDGTLLDKAGFDVILKYYGTQRFSIRQLVMQMSSFNLSSYTKDFALVILDSSLNHADLMMSAISLANSTFAANTSCQINGWGSSDGISYADFLFTTNVTLFSPEDCFNHTKFTLADMKCVGFLNQSMSDVCTTDTGGPVICDGQLSGIVSWGIKCGEVDMIGVYTDVAYHRQWIDQTISNILKTNARKHLNFDEHMSNKIKEENLQIGKESAASHVICCPTSLCQVFRIVLLCILAF